MKQNTITNKTDKWIWIIANLIAIIAFIIKEKL